MSGTFSSAVTIASACAGRRNHPRTRTVRTRVRLAVARPPSSGSSLVRVVAGVGVGLSGLSAAGLGVGRAAGDGGVLGQGLGEADVAAGLGAVQAVAEGEELGGVVGAEFLGVAVLVEAGDEVQAVGLSAGEVGLEGVESRELFAAAHRPHRSLAEEFHTANSRHSHRQFSNPETLVFKGFDYPQAPITVDNFVNVALGKMFAE